MFGKKFSRDSNNKYQRLELIKKFDFDAYSCYNPNSFVFFSLPNQKTLFLIFATKNVSIIFMDLQHQKIITEIKKVHLSEIKSLRLLKLNQIDYLMTVSYEEIKIWSINNWDCISYIKDITKSYIFTIFRCGCFLVEKNNYYIIASHHIHNTIKDEDFYQLKIYDNQNKLIREMARSNDYIEYIDAYNENNQSFVIISSNKKIISYDYRNNLLLYKEYIDDDLDNLLNYFLVYQKNGTKLICKCRQNINIWDFHTGKVLNKIKIYECIMYIGFLDNGDNNDDKNNYLFALLSKNYLKILDLNSYSIVGSYFVRVLNEDGIINSIKNFNIPNQGNFFLTQQRNNGKFKILKIPD